jgi:exosortase A-associated hydrolase 1
VNSFAHFESTAGWQFTESALTFRCQGETLVGVVSAPADRPRRRQGVVIVVGGPQYRVGSHRQFVRLARRLAREGYCALRFDHRGIGDSSGAQITFEDAGPDILAAIDALRENCPQVREVIVWALCDAASAALIHATGHPQVAGMVLLNPWVRSESSLAKAHLKHYYRARLLQPGFWRKLLRGEFELAQSLRSMLASARLVLAHEKSPRSGVNDADFQTKMAQGLRRFRGRVLLVLSGNDLTAREFIEYSCSAPAWRGLLDSPLIEKLRLSEADHTFSHSKWRQAVEEATTAWLDSFAKLG